VIEMCEGALPSGAARRRRTRVFAPALLVVILYWLAWARSFLILPAILWFVMVLRVQRRHRRARGFGAILMSGALVRGRGGTRPASSSRCCWYGIPADRHRCDRSARAPVNSDAVIVAGRFSSSRFRSVRRDRWTLYYCAARARADAGALIAAVRARTDRLVLGGGGARALALARPRRSRLARINHRGRPSRRRSPRDPRLGAHHARRVRELVRARVLPIGVALLGLVDDAASAVHGVRAHLRTLRTGRPIRER